MCRLSIISNYLFIYGLSHLGQLLSFIIFRIPVFSGSAFAQVFGFEFCVLIVCICFSLYQELFLSSTLNETCSRTEKEIFR